MVALGRGRWEDTAGPLSRAPSWMEAAREEKTVAAVRGNHTLPVPLEHEGKMCQPAVQKEGRELRVQLRRSAKLARHH